MPSFMLSVEELDLLPIRVVAWVIGEVLPSVIVGDVYILLSEY